MIHKCSICTSRCPAGELRGMPCEILTESNKVMNRIERGKLSSGADTIKFKGPEKHPKEGPRVYRKGDKEKFDSGYDRIWSKPPVCAVCHGKSDPGTCPNCD